MCARVGELRERELVGVEVGLGRAELRVARGLAVAVRVDVRAARQADPAQAVEQRRDRVVAERRQHHRQAAGELDRAHVDHPERHLALRRIALGHRVGVRGEPHLRGRHADQRTAHPASTHVSFAPPFWDELTTSAPASNATRVRPPGRDARIVVAPEEDIRAQVDVARRELAVDHGRMAREHHHALGHERGRALEHGLAHRLDVPRLGVREDRDALAAVAAARLDDELVEDVHRALEDLGPAEVEGLHRGQQRLLIQVEANHVLDVGVRQLVVGDPGAERVDDADAALAHQLEQQPADRRVEPVRVRAPVDDVDVVARGELLRLEQRDAERLGGPLVLVVGGVGLAVGEQRGARAPVGGRGGLERDGQQRRELVERARGVARA